MHCKPNFITLKKKKLFCKRILELDFKRNKEAKINFVLLSIIPI